MIKQLNDIKWKVFEVNDLFEIFTGATIPKKDLRKGEIPRVTASEERNGITYFTSRLNHKNYREYENFISISFLGNVFYQKGKVSLDMKIHGVKIKGKELNEYIALFLIPIFKKIGIKYNYGYQLSTSVLRKQKILLPANLNGEPDWDCMENFMQEVEKEVKPNFKFKDHTINDRRELKDVMWKEFFIEDLFEVKRGKRLIKKNQIKGIRPYVSSTGLNNGVDNFISNETGVRIYEDCLTIANSGSVGVVFYHPYDFVASDHVTHIKKKGLNKYQYLFLATILKKLGEKYSFNREISDKRLKREKIMLPIDEKGEPDWGFMEQYMKRMENELMRPVI